METLFESNGAEFSECGNYRYKLWRIWDRNGKMAMCIGLNPSTANAEANDATIGLLTRVLTKLGYGGFYMMNCFLYITSNPKLLKHNPMSDEWNDNVLTVTAARCSDVIFAWGAFKVIKETGRDEQLIEMFPSAKCFGKNKNGTPVHPLALMYNGTQNDPQLLNFVS